jgi:DNA repair exonuclease SbcCD ATPase subunit
MSSLKQLKQEEKNAVLQQQVIAELNVIVQDIERSEKLIVTLNQDLQEINAKFQGPRDTRADIAYLTNLLECAKRKLAWEKQISSLQKRTPSVMERMGTLLNDPTSPASSEARDQMLRALQSIQAAMERLEQASSSAGGADARSQGPPGAAGT